MLSKNNKNLMTEIKKSNKILIKSFKTGSIYNTAKYKKIKQIF